MTRGVLLARSVPIIGWALLLLGIVRPYRSTLMRRLFWVDVALSVGAHGLQIPAAQRAASTRGIGSGRAALMTMIFGATWWKTLPESVDR